MKYKYHLVVTDKMKTMIMNKKYKSDGKKKYLNIVFIFFKVKEIRSVKKPNYLLSQINFIKAIMKNLVETDDDLQEKETNTVQVWANIDPPFIDGLLNDTNLLYMIKLVRNITNLIL